MALQIQRDEVSINFWNAFCRLSSKYLVLIWRRGVQREYYFGDFAINDVFESRTRTLTEADIVNFAGISGDFVEIHMSEQWASAGPFGKRLPHALLVLSISIGQMTQMDIFGRSLRNFPGIDALQVLKPTFIGDTIRTKKQVLDKKDQSDQEGLVVFRTAVLNQKNEEVMVYNDRFVVRKK